MLLIKKIMSPLAMYLFRSTPRARLALLICLWALFACLSKADTSAPENNVPADSVVVFNELMYHPESDSRTDEWIELHNQMSVDVDLSRWELTGGIGFQFPTGTILPAGAYVVIAVKARMVERDAASVLIAAINDCEHALRLAFPQVHWIFFEPDVAA